MDWRLRNWAWLVAAALLGGCETLPRRAEPTAAEERGTSTERTGNEAESASLPASWRDRRQSLAAPGAISQSSKPAPLASEIPPQKQSHDAHKPAGADVTGKTPRRGSAEGHARIPPRPPEIAAPVSEQHEPPLLAVRLAPPRQQTATLAATDEPALANEISDRPGSPAEPAAPSPLEPPAVTSTPKAAENPLVTEEPVAKVPPAPPRTLEAPIAGPPEPARAATFEESETAADDLTLVKFTDRPSAPGDIVHALPDAPRSLPTSKGTERLEPVFPGLAPPDPMPGAVAESNVASSQPPADAPAARGIDLGEGLRTAVEPMPAVPASSSPPPPLPASTEERPALALAQLALCEEISGFGDFRSFAGKSLRPGQQVLIYAEVRNFVSREVDGQFETRLGTELTVEAPDGSTIAVPFDDIVDRCKVRRSDFYCRYTFKLPEALTPGAHRLRVRIKDHNGGAAAEQTLRVEVAPAR